MHFVMFYHSLVSDWNHGNAHFLRGVVRDLLVRGHRVDVWEPIDGWSLKNQIADGGRETVTAFRERYPLLQSQFYDPATIDLDETIGDADVVIVHEWNDQDLIRRIGQHRARHGRYALLFHDTHHRSVTAPETMPLDCLEHFDGVLAFGQVIRDLYVERGWVKQAWTWHEAADTEVFHPLPKIEPTKDLVWIGNWGDEERTEELDEYLFRPIQSLGLRSTVFGVRYPELGLVRLKSIGARYGGWLPNYQAPEVFARHRATVHVPRRPYREQLPGIPTIRVFEALACGIPLISAPWEDSEGLFRPGKDFLVAHNGQEMTSQLRDLMHDEQLTATLAESGLQRIRAKHTCRHRVDQLLEICSGLLGASFRQESSEAVGVGDFTSKSLQGKGPSA